MRKTILIAGLLYPVYASLVWYLSSLLGLHGTNAWVFRIALWLLGLAAAGITVWYMAKMNKEETASNTTSLQSESTEDISVLIRDAQYKLASSPSEKGVKLGSLPMVFLVGESGSAKTTTIVNSGIDAELLAGEVLRDGRPVATPAANIWFARRTLFVELAGRYMADPSVWANLVRRLQPASFSSAVKNSQQAPRLALVFLDLERFANFSGPEQLQAAAKGVRARLSEISQSIGVNIPVYVLFTKTDRLPFFADYVRNFTQEEVNQALGVTLPGQTPASGVYSEEQTRRIGAYFDQLASSLCNFRPEFLARENDASLLPGIYEFPREFRKLRTPLVQFLVELCRPSQLTLGPFLRGFYFSGARPIITNERAAAEVKPVITTREPELNLGATRIFTGNLGAAMEAPRAEAPRPVASRKVPQWVFLGRFFNNVLFGDSQSSSAGVSTRTSLMRRILLASAAALSLLYAIALIVSYFNNSSLESRIAKAARSIPAEITGSGSASRDALENLESQRQDLELLEGFHKDGAPWSYRWGLYSGDEVRPQARRLYFEGFRRLLMAQTQATMNESLTALPLTPGPEYKPTYDTLKAYLITTSNPDKSTQIFLSPVLLNRWSNSRNVDAPRLELAKKQFDFYSDTLKIGNPFSSENDTVAIEKARRYLKQFGGVERIYQAMLIDAGKSRAPINFNKLIAGSAEVVIDSHEVAAAFTKPGWDSMKDSLKNPDRYFSAEQWVLGDQTPAGIDRASVSQELTRRYYDDFVKEWRLFMNSASLVKYANLKDATRKLNLLSGNQSPLLALFSLASQNTNVDVPEVSKVFQSVQAVVPPAITDHYIDPANQGYMVALGTLQSTIEAAANLPEITDTVAQRSLDNAMSARVAVRGIAQNFRFEQGHLEAQSQKLLEDPITNVEGMLRGAGPDELNKKGGAFCGDYRRVMSKLPFNVTSKTSATVAEINALFRKPDGALWAFYESTLQKYMVKNPSGYGVKPDSALKISPSFVAFFNRAAAISDSMYTSDSQDPKISYSLKKVSSQTVTLTIDGQPNSDGKRVWQVNGVHGVTSKIDSMGDFPWANVPGLWAAFQFLGEADEWKSQGGNYLLEWKVYVGVGSNREPRPPVRYELDLGNNSPISPKGFSAAVGCIPTIALK